MKNASKPVLRNLLPPLILMILILVAGAAILLCQQYINKLATQTAHDHVNLSSIVDFAMRQQAIALEATARTILADGRVADALITGNNTTNLLAEWQPVFDTLRRQYNVTHFYFSDTNRNIILRVYDPACRGGHNNRFTALEAEQTGTSAAGLELGSTGVLALRVVLPVFSASKFAGYIELGRDIQAVMEMIPLPLDTDIAVTVRKEYLDQTTWSEHGSRHTSAYPFTRETLPESVLIYNSMTNLHYAAIESIAAHDLTNIPGNATTQWETSFNDREWNISATALYDAAGTAIGNLLIFSDISANKAAFRRTMQAGGLFAIIILVALIGFVVIILRRTDNEINSQQNALQANEAKLRLLTDNMTDILWTSDLNMALTFVSPSIQRVLGYTVEEYMARTPADNYTPASLMVITSALKEELLDERNPDCDKNRTRIVEAQHRKADGSLTWVAIHASFLRNARGEATGLVGITRDVSNIKKWEVELTASKNLLEATINSIPDVIGILKTDHTVIRYNQAGYSMLGKTPEQVYGRKCHELIGRNTPCEECATIKCIADQKPQAIEKFVTNMGVWLEARAYPVFDQQGDMVHIIEHLRDITERKRTETMLRRLTQLQRILVEISTKFINLPIERLDEAIDNALAKIGSFADADRAYLFEYDQEKQICHKTHEWHSSELSPEIKPHPETIPFADISDAVTCHMIGKPFRITDIKSLAAEDAIRRYFAPLGIRSMLSVPLMNWGECLGFVGFDSATRQQSYNIEEERLLIIFSQMLVNARIRRQIETELRESEEENRSIVQVMPDIIFKIDRHGRYLEVKTASDKKLANPKSELLKKNIRDVFPAKEADLMMNCIKKALDSRELQIVEYALDVPAGRLMFEGRILFCAENEVLIFVRDITAQKEAQKALVLAKEEAEQANRAKSEFLSNMSHELRTPLSPILGFAALLLKAPNLTNEQRTWINIIIHRGKDLQSLIGNVLDLAKIEVDKIIIQREPLPLHATVGEMIKSVTPLTDSKGLRLEWDISPEIPENCLADGLRLRQIILNLLSNAIKFTESGEITLSVKDGRGSQLKRQPDRDEAALLFSIRDTGIGIPPDRQAAIFEGFTQADHAHAVDYGGGAGLGLTIAKKLVEFMDGNIWVASSPGHGSTFQFTIIVGTGDTETNSTEIPQPSSEANNHRRLNILIVDDDPDILKLTERIMDYAGHASRTARDGREALAILEIEKFDIILMDIQMPELDGLEATRRIRSGITYRGEGTHDSSCTPIIAITARATNSELDQCMNAGMDDYILKPINLEKLNELLDKWTPKREE